MQYNIYACGLAVALGQCALGQNLISNPGFEAGNTGFQSDYAFAPGGNCCEGEYTVRNNGSTFNPGFVNPPQSSPGSILMMVVNGSTVPNVRTWYQTVTVTPGRTYELSLRGCTAVAGGPAILQWQVNGVLIGNQMSLPNATGTWVTMTALWTAPAGTTSVLIAIRNLNTATFPNDFYLDDLSMSIACSADFNGDGVVDFFDYLDFVDAFSSQATEADFNNDGVIDFFDYLDFVDAFSGGC